MTDVNKTTSPAAVNLILYGPPGTGKTYRTAWEAVRLCIGDEAAARLKDDRDALMTEYRRLANEGRIEFVTFHQSMSYEEFVEGLRPSAGDDDREDFAESDSGVGSPGFQLNCHDGIFKRISERARLDPGNNGATHRLDRSQRLFKFSLIGPDWSQQLRQAINHNGVVSKAGADCDLSAPEFEDGQRVQQELQNAHPDMTDRCTDIGEAQHFRSKIDIDDYVVLTRGTNRIVALGRVAGDYEFHRDVDRGQHFRKVTWIWHSEEGASRSAFYPKKFTGWQPLYELKSDRIDWNALEEIAFGEEASRGGDTDRGYVLIIDEINRANISKVFGELITLLEKDKRLGTQNEVRVQLPYSKKRFGVPSNLHIVGTMNTADRSIALLDTALRRRFAFQELMPDPTILPANVDGINLRKLLATINERIEYLFDREHQIGHAYFTDCKNQADIEDVMRHKVIPLLAEYFYEDWSKVAAVLGDGPDPEGNQFLYAQRLQPPSGMIEDGLGDGKLRWGLKERFDFSEFKA